MPHFPEGYTMEEKKMDIEHTIKMHNMMVQLMPAEACAAMFGVCKGLVEEGEIALAAYALSQSDMPSIQLPSEDENEE